MLGTDCAGEVVEVGSKVTQFKPGDRVLAHAIGMEKPRNTAAEGAFQEHTVVVQQLAAKIPDNMSYESAAVLPLGFSTAACGLYEKDQLALPYPSLNPMPNGKTLLIWGGSSSVGCNAIQLGVASGYEVITTASPHNIEYLKKLGASQVFDYNSPTVVRDVIAAFQTRELAGAMSIGYGATDLVLDIVPRCQGNKHITAATFPGPKTPPTRFIIPNMVVSFLPKMIAYTVKSRMRGVKMTSIWGGSLANTETSKAVYADFLPIALAQARFQAAPGPMVVGHGLDKINTALETLQKGVSAKKVVVTL